MHHAIPESNVWLCLVLNRFGLASAQVLEGVECCATWLPSWTCPDPSIMLITVQQLPIAWAAARRRTPEVSVKYTGSPVPRSCAWHAQLLASHQESARCVVRLFRFKGGFA